MNRLIFSDFRETIHKLSPKDFSELSKKLMNVGDRAFNDAYHAPRMLTEFQKEAFSRILNPLIGTTGVLEPEEINEAVVLVMGESLKRA